MVSRPKITNKTDIGHSYNFMLAFFIFDGGFVTKMIVFGGLLLLSC
jgi:hypothetical protein